MARAAVIPGVSAEPQRSTRGRPRTAALPDEGAQKKAEPAKRGRKPGKTTAATKNKKEDEADDDEDDDLSLDLAASTSRKATASTAAKAKATTTRQPRKDVAKAAVEVNDNDNETEDDELADFEVPRTKTVRPKAKAVTASVPAKPTRGRPKAVKATEQEEKKKKKKKTTTTTTRSRKAATSRQDKTIYVTTASTASSLAKARTLGDPAKKKKVTFADLDDSEDGYSTEELPARVVKKTTAVQKAAGLKAKPVRKTGTATRGRPPKAAAKPLSPKKATQLAKGSASSASSDEDELASEKTMYSLVVQKSPVRTQEQHTGLSSPVKRIMLPGQSSTPARLARPASQDENQPPPSALRDAVFMGSPARRPPPSTSKETIRDTPRRGPLFINHPSASKLSSNPEASTFLQKLSPLKASPKKGGNLAASFLSAASPEKAPGTPFNAKLSLLQSPAKRVQSPFIFQTDISKQIARDADADDDTDMDDDTFANGKQAAQAYMVELSDDELSIDVMPARENDSDDVFVDTPEPVHVHEDEGHEDSHVQDDEIVGEFAELVVDAHEYAEDSVQDVDEDVVMENDEMLDLNENTEFADDVDDKENLIEHTAEIEDIPALESTECESPKDAEVTLEDAEIATESVEEPAEPTEVADSEHIVIYAEPENEEEEEDDVPDVETHRSNTTLTSARSSIDPRDILAADDIDENDENEFSPAEQTSFVPPAPTPPVTSPARTFRMSFRDNNDDTYSEYGTSPASRRQSTSSGRNSILPRSDSADDTFTSLAAKLSSWKASSPEKMRKSMSFRDNNDDTYSEYGVSPASRRQSTFSGRDSILPQHRSPSADDTFSSLATKLSSWKASSPEKSRKGSTEQSIFSPVVPSKLSNPRPSLMGNKYTQIQTMRRSLAARHSSANSVVMDGDESDTLSRQSQEPVTTTQSETTQSEETADKENSNPHLSMSITPVRIIRDTHRTVHTVSKVPLKPEADESPIKYPRKRARSMSTDIQLPIRASPSRFKLVPKSRKSVSPSPSTSTRRSPLAEVGAHDPEVSSPAPTTPSKSTTSTAATPSKSTPATRRTPKADQHFLRGAVVFVDVHTTEGEDASGIFIELLTQMGAKCVKSWSWNPRSSHSPGVDGAEPATNTSKVGITHVVYKDGGVRTMEKVRQAGELVKCVGVGWVLEYASSLRRLFLNANANGDIVASAQINGSTRNITTSTAPSYRAVAPNAARACSPAHCPM
jgi:hypothetical protein